MAGNVNQIRAFVAGLPGVGKTTALSGVPLPVIKFGEQMHRLAQRRGFTGSKDDLRRLTDNELMALRSATIQHLPDGFVLDGHLVIENSGMIRDAVPDEFRRRGMFSQIVVLEADSQELIRRRLGRPGRLSGDPKHIIAQQAAQRTAAADLAHVTGAALVALDTTWTSPAAARSLLLDALQIKKRAL